MSLKNYFKVAVFATIMSLLYIHMQMKIFELAYKGKDKEKIEEIKKFISMTDMGFND